MKHLSSLFLFLLLTISFNVFAADPNANCGLTEDGKKLDTWYWGVCPQNIGQQIKYSFLGVGAFGTYSADNLVTKPEEIDAILSEAQLNTNKNNQNLFQLIIMFVYGIALFLGIFLSAPYAYGFLKALMTGESHDKEGQPARYAGFGLFSIMTSALGVLIFMPGLYGFKGSLSAGGYLGASAGNGSGILENMIISRFLNKLENGGLETKQDDGTLKDYREKQQNSQTYYASQATVAGLISTSLVINSTSAFNNAIINLGVNDKSWNVRDKTADVWQPNDNDGIDFIKKFPEDPNQTMWAADAIPFAKNPESVAETIPYLKAVNYNKSYRDFDDIDGLVNQATKLGNDIQTSSFYDNTAGFEEIRQSAVAYFYKDALANILRKNFLKWMEKSDEIADLVVNYECSKVYSSRISAQNFINAHSEKPTNSGGNVECVSNDWKVMGEGKTADYAQQVYDKSQALIDEYYDVRIKVNTAMNTSFRSDELHKKIVDIYHKGFLSLVFYLPSLTDDLNFSSLVQNQFQNSAPMTTLQSQALGSFVIDDWAIAHGYGSANESDIQIGEAVRELNLIPNSTGTPSLKDSSSILQKLYSTQATASGQSRDYLQAVGTGLNNPKLALAACLNTTTYPVTCMQKYGQQVSETMVDIMYIAATVQLFSVVTSHYGDKKKDKVLSEKAKEDEKSGLSKKQTAFNGKKINSKPNFLQLVGAVTGGLSKAAFSWALFGYLISTVLKFGSMVLMTTPFAVLYILNILFFLITIATMPITILAFVRMNDKDNLANIRKTFISTLFSLLLFGPMIVIMYIINYQLTAIFDQIIIPSATKGLGAAFASGSWQILQATLETFVAFVCYIVINYTCLKYSFRALEESMKIMQLNMPFMKHGTEFVGKINSMLTISTGGISKLLNMVIANRVDNLAFKMMGKVFKKKIYRKK